MSKLLILLILFSCTSYADKSLFNPKPTPSEFVLYMPDLEKNFMALINGSNKCSLESYRKMEDIIYEVYIWMHFQQSIKSLDMLNSMTGKLQIDFSKDDEPSELDVIQMLNAWRIRECTVKEKKIIWD